MIHTFKLRQAEIFDNTPQIWRQVNVPWSGPCPLPSMLCVDECKYLYYLAKNQCSGRGAIVDCGPLAGGSTIALASGAHPSTPIHSYDLWSFCPGWEAFFPNHELAADDDLSPHFRANVSQFASAVTPHKGDLATQRWSGGSIELMFIDAAKTPRVMHNLVTEFFPHLVPGALVLHQDYVSSQCPWIHVAAIMLQDFFEWVDSPAGGTVCARLVREVPRRLLPGNYFDALTLEQAKQLMTEASDVCVGWERLCVKLALAKLLILRDRSDLAAQVCDEVKRDPDFREPYVGPDLVLIEAELQERR